MGTVFVIDDDEAVRDGLSVLLETAGFHVESYRDAEAFLQDMHVERPGCVVLDVKLPGLHGPETQAEMTRRGIHNPILFLSAHGDIPTTVRAIQAGAIDFLTKPVDGEQLISRVQTAIAVDAKRRQEDAAQRAKVEAMSKLSRRERDVLALAISGLQNKEIARELGISHRTVEVHRSRILLKTGASTLLGLAGLAHDTGILKASHPSPILGGASRASPPLRDHT